MVTRLSADAAFLDDQGFEQLANALRQQREKLYTVTAFKAEAERTVRALEQRGYDARAVHTNGVYRVVYVNSSPRVRVADAQRHGLVRCNDGLYRAFTREAGLYDYDFDDGAVWKVEKFDDGEYLVKVVDDDDEERVVRQASAETLNFVTPMNYANTMRMFYGEVSQQMLNDVEHDSALRVALVQMLNRKVRAKVVDVLRMHRFGDRALTADLAEAVAKAGVTSAKQLINVVTAHLLDNARG